MCFLPIVSDCVNGGLYARSKVHYIKHVTKVQHFSILAHCRAILMCNLSCFIVMDVMDDVA